MFTKCKNTKRQGIIGLGVAINYFCSQGYTVSVPLNDSKDYDLVVEIDGQLKKVQVKTTRYKRKSSYELSLKCAGGNSKKNFVHKKGSEISFDLLFVLTASGKTYLIPREDVGETVSLCEKYSKFEVAI